MVNPASAHISSSKPTGPPSGQYEGVQFNDSIPELQWPDWGCQEKGSDVVRTWKLLKEKTAVYWTYEPFVLLIGPDRSNRELNSAMLEIADVFPATVCIWLAHQPRDTVVTGRTAASSDDMKGVHHFQLVISFNEILQKPLSLDLMETLDFFFASSVAYLDELCTISEQIQICIFLRSQAGTNKAGPSGTEVQ